MRERDLREEMERRRRAREMKVGRRMGMRP